MVEPVLPDAATNALAAYDADALKVLQSFTTKAEQSATPDIIYHYTDDMGLRGIVETGELWFTDIFDLNDPSELRHGFSLAARALNARATDERPETRQFARSFEAMGVHGGLEQSAHFFVCCFSRNGDELGQWRAYGDNGRGFALGFRTRVLEDAFGKADGQPIPQHLTFPITYDDDQLAKIQSDLVSLMHELISLPRSVKMGKEQVNIYMRELSVYHSVSAVRAVIFFKHPAYRNEEEYRFLQLFAREATNPPAVQYRHRPYSLVRYRKFDWRKVARGALAKIVVGPSADKERAVQFAADCCEAFHAEKVELVKSTVPYRVA